ncbi:MAG: acetylornithine deacetylase/succinyl-diaminopimelate desuccinylase family protein [Gemmatimonadota bacterium]|uniref:acetylornithine deacetylase/succinyl-diaminopimelate desuccinylase family protein n=1 Tax=Candidatus Palauibacter scopulicola TaxID=3056741 RepID=UPI0023961F0A|nr:acetylornithine deacetylase/succinyl-diaminopimelate desuccinylase family protein [Candidatus Palauibacter scopulicola]MDE2663216.1 acetylornithine deacetylase/succinyl-diaminopimelate desuccinylase family protein [Candidatus Palauibacter scopulicola]
MHPASPPTALRQADRVLAEVEAARDEIVAFTAEMIRIPTVNPPGDCYRECAEFIGRRLETAGLAVEYVEAEGRPEHTAAHPRVNAVGRGDAGPGRPRLHLNGHFDVVPPGEEWTVDPFAGTVRDGRIYGRGASDMKSGIAAAVFAVEALRRAGVELDGAVDISATVDEESGGFAGVAHLCEAGIISSDDTRYAIIPEPFGPARVCLGHRGVYWFDVVAHGHAAHGSMSHLGRSAIDDMGTLLEAFRTRLAPTLAARLSALPVVPAPSRRPSLNVNAITGGQAGEATQSPCVADRCVATFDRRFIPEESFEEVRAEIERLVASVESDDPDRRFTIEERMVVHPTSAPPGSPLVAALSRAVETAVGRPPELVASPGTYDQKHFARIAGIEHCVAYGPGPLEEAHQPDESCAIDDLVACTQALALTALELLGPA